MSGRAGRRGIDARGTVLTLTLTLTLSLTLTLTLTLTLIPTLAPNQARLGRLTLPLPIP